MIFALPFGTLLTALLVDAWSRTHGRPPPSGFLAVPFSTMEAFWKEQGMLGPVRLPETPLRPGHSALDQLRRNDVQIRMFALDEDYARLPENHPLVWAEAVVGPLELLAVQQAPETLPTARLLLDIAGLVDREALDDAREVIAYALLERDDLDCMKLGQRVVDELVQERPENRRRWLALRAAYDTTLGDHARAMQDAWDLALDPAAEQPHLFLAALAMDTLAKSARDVRDEARAGSLTRWLVARMDPSVREMFEAGKAPKLLVSDRTVPRFRVPLPSDEQWHGTA